LRFSEALAQALPNMTFVHSIPHTTRAPRDGEVDGDDYYFVSMDAMSEGLANKMFIEAGKYKVC
jgi:guanylate kinase